MKSFICALLAFGLWASTGAAAPLEVYGRAPAMTGVVLSPDGKKIAFISTIGVVQQVIVQDIASGMPVASVLGGEFKIRGVQWADDDNVIVKTSNTTGLRGGGWWNSRNEYWRGITLTVGENKVRPLLYETAAESLLILQGDPMPRRIDGQTVVFTESVAFVTAGSRNSIFRTDLGQRRTHLVLAGEPNTRDMLVNARGEIIAQSEFFEHSEPGRLRLRQKNGTWRTVEIPQGVIHARFIGLGRNEDSVLVYYERDKKELIAEISISTSAWSEPLSDTTPDRIFSDPATHLAIGYASLVGDETTYKFFDPADQKAWRSVTAAFPGQAVRWRSVSANHRRFLVSVDSPTEGLAYSLVDLDAKSAVWLGAAYADLGPGDVSPVTPITYKAADGLEITGYLTLPHGAQARDLPLIVLPHGGPEARDTLGFDYWSQALASRGYAVLQPNFRGSDGFGRPFLEAGYGEWGKKMQTDLSDGVRHLAAQGVIDPKRVCILGLSYGGYAALAGAAIDRGVYRCAVSIAGPSDLKHMLAVGKYTRGEGALRYWKEFMGVDGARDPDLIAISPAHQAAKVDIPVLLIHGKDDMVVDYEQSTIMAAALRKAGKPVEFISLEGEDHWLSRADTRLKTLQSAVAFVEKHNPPDPSGQIASAP